MAVVRYRVSPTRRRAAGNAEPPAGETPGGVASKEALLEADRLLTAVDVAALYQVHPKTVYAWAERGEIPVVRLGNRTVRFRPEDVEKLVADRLVPADGA